MAPRKPTEKMWVDRTLHDNRIFLQNEVALAADKMLDTTCPGNPWEYFTCPEVEALACIFAAAGRQDVYDFIIYQHALADDSEEVEFHLDMYGDSTPPKPLGKEQS